MKAFEYDRAASLPAGAAAAAGGARLLAGGTDLVPLMKDRLLSPERLVDVSRAAAGPAIAPREDGGLRLDALCTLADLASDDRVRRDYPALAEAAAASATPQIRNMATVGGNLCQWNRCWYFRSGVPCHLNGGHDCPAARGDNRYHALWTDGPCVAVHPSDPAVALAAYGAEVEVTGAAGLRRVPVTDFLRAPAPGSPEQAALEAGEAVSGVYLGASNGRLGAYEKAMDRHAWAFALVSVAVVLSMRAGVVTNADVVVGGVAAVPRRADQAGAALKGRPLTAEVAAEAADAAVSGARPLSHNGYKVPLVKALVRSALDRLAGAAAR